ncbi:hypothetical protein BaRGS_00035261 [Batillaria attramentaria]|uniref:Uncharacterized protein n=1 Tax=Batillaria attramentaria TaxID=370345 RepID=A0ABD0JF87_9CAEN
MGTWSKTVFSRCGINPKRLQCFRKVSNFTVQRLSTSHRPPKQRRPELIRRRKPFSEQPDGQRLVHNLSYGLYDKCERIQQELTQTTLQLMGDRAIVVMCGKDPVKLLRTFFRSLSVVLKPGSGAGIQFYPQNVGSRLKKEADDAITEILQEQPDAKVYFIHLDLSSFKSVRRFADEFMHRGWPLHLLINNAGVMLVPHQVTEDGNEYHLQVNHLSHALLTSLLLPLLETSATEARLSHVINVTSVVHHVASMDPDTFGDECEGPWSYSPHNAYAASKLAILLYTKALSRRLGDQQSNVTVSAVHPGVVNTGLYQHIHWTIAWAFHIMKQYLFMKPEQAAQSVLHLAMMSNKQATSGGYYENGRQTTSSSQSNILTHQETVYTKTCKMIQTKLD